MTFVSQFVDKKCAAVAHSPDHSGMVDHKGQRPSVCAVVENVVDGGDAERRYMRGDESEWLG